MPLLSPLIALPNISDIIASSTSAGQPLFDAIWPIAVVGLGITLVGLIIGALFGWIGGAVRAMTGKKDE